MTEETTPATILICEDDPMISVFFADVFKQAGLDVIAVHDGESAIAKALELQPAVITLDIDLPGLDGGAVLARLRSSSATAHIPIVVVSAHPGWLTFMDRGHSIAVLEKPVPPWELVATVRMALERSKQAES